MARRSVLISNPKADAFVESAMAAAAGKSKTFPKDKHRALHGLTLDADFAAVPIRRRRIQGTTAVFAAAATPQDRPVAPENADRFLVRGQIDENDLAVAQQEAQDNGLEIFADPAIYSLPGGVSWPNGPIGTSADVRGLMGAPALHDLGMDGGDVAVAIVDTGVNLAHLRDRGMTPRLDATIAWTPHPIVDPGRMRVGHGTMCAYSVLNCAPNAVLLDFAVLQSRRQGGSVMDGLLSDAIAAFGQLLNELSKPLTAQAHKALVVNNSWGMYNPSWDFPVGDPGRYGDNPQHPFNLQVEALAQAGADILFAAGNCGSQCPDYRCRDDQGQIHTAGNISGANGHPDVLCVAGVDVNEDRVCYSSEGPGLLSHEKPDIAAYTHFYGSAAYGPHSADTGTSTACPVAAGAVAAIRTKISPATHDPAALFTALRATAKHPNNVQGHTTDFGYGVIRPVAAATSLLHPPQA